MAVSPDTKGRWIVTWGSAQQLTEPQNNPPKPYLQNNTLRQVIHVSVGGKRVRFKFSNCFTGNPVKMHAVHVALSARRSSIIAECDTALTFRGKTSVVIPSREEIYSDPLDFNIKPVSDIAVSIFFGEISGKSVTGHPGSRCTSYIKEGDAVAAPSFPGAKRVEHWYILAGLEVWAPESGATLVIMGDSITDGRGSTTDKNNRWPDILAQRLQADKNTAGIGIYNAGIGGNCVLRGGLGPAVMNRLERDVLNQNGVRWMILLNGVNDIGAAKGREKYGQSVADELIAAYEKVIEQAHAAGIRVYGATITPFEDSFYDSPETAEARQKVNEWIRNSGKFDAVIDMDMAVRDPGKASKLRRAADCGDHLHLSPEGYRMMAEAVDLGLFA